MSNRTDDSAQWRSIILALMCSILTGFTLGYLWGLIVFFGLLSILNAIFYANKK